MPRVVTTRGVRLALLFLRLYLILLLGLILLSFIRSCGSRKPVAPATTTTAPATTTTTTATRASAGSPLPEAP